ncbi:MAG: hypothetical protein JKX76_00740 [Colwellia sp.]|nr:hypothetical protein [Colwellia sp.]
MHRSKSKNQIRVNLNKEFKRKYKFKTDVSGCDGQEVYDLDYDSIRDLVDLHRPCSLTLSETVEEIIIELQKNDFDTIRLNSEQIDILLQPIVDCISSSG